MTLALVLRVPIPPALRSCFGCLEHRGHVGSGDGALVLDESAPPTMVELELTMASEEVSMSSPPAIPTLC